MLRRLFYSRFYELFEYYCLFNNLSQPTYLKVSRSCQLGADEVEILS